MERFWGETSPSSARNSLNVAIHTIRKHFTKALPQQDLLIYKNECYSINTDLDIRTDVEQFAAYFQKGSIMEQNQGLEHALGAYNKAVALYRGDFMEDMLYEEWCEAVRDNLKETFLLILDRQSNFFFEQASYSVAITICKKMLEKDPCLEEVHRKLIVCYKQLGQQDKAIKQFYKCAQSLQEELGLVPSEETKALLNQLRKRG
jgi:DNA-binding SARP family transcriptional activator